MYAMLAVPLNKIGFRSLIAEHYQIIGVLLSALLLAIGTGTYTNWDAALEFEAATSVLNHGFPIVTTGLMINQPPLGFYMDAPVFSVIGLTYLNGIGIATAFGLGCVALIYIIGRTLYGKNSGLAAAILFGFVPWHVYLSRIFLIDNQYLFFSLLALTFGIFAVRHGSERLILASGIAFAVAFLTKLYAIFIIVPLILLVVFYFREKSYHLTTKKVLLFLVPSLLLQTVWYGGLANQNFAGVYLSSDLTHPEYVANPSLMFLPVVWVASTGWFLLLAAAFAVVLPLVFRRKLASQLWVDALCVTSVAVVAGLNMLLVLGLHLTVPYISVVKYGYLALPFLCLLAGSLVDKILSLVGKVNLVGKMKTAKIIFGGFGLVLVFASLIESVTFLHEWDGFVSFGVDTITYYGFYVYSPPVMSLFEITHYGAIVIAVVSLLLPLLLNNTGKLLSQYYLFR